MTLDGACGVTKIVPREVSLVESDTVGDRNAAFEPRVALMRLMEGYFQIPAAITTLRVSVFCTRESLYVQRMYLYFTGVDEDVPAPPVSIIMDVPQMRPEFHRVSNSVLLLPSWYWRSMR